MSEESANKRIAKNTIFLYSRSLLTMAISIFSSRIILQALGVDDYGLYGAIGSIVTMFSIINNTLAVGTSRFLTFELGKGDDEKLKKTFSAAFAMHVAMAVALFILLETIGLWFLNNRMQIPEGREFAANVIFHLSIISCMFGLTQVPYNALIVAHEKMKIYAYIGIFEVMFKLVLVLVLLYVPFKDNLIAFGIIVAAWGIGLQIFYRFYCYKRFPESHLTLCRDKSIYKGMLSYSMWDFVGQFCARGNGQGVNILINMFFGVSVNAARTVAYQVENALTSFSGNFLAAVNPQIVKAYAQEDYKRFFQLIFESGKFAYYLLFMLSLPVFLEAKFILSIWLVEVPEYTVLFLRCIIAITLFRILVRPLINGVHATGNIKTLNLTSGVYSALTFLPMTYLLYKMSFPVWTCFVVQAFNGIVCTYLETRALYKNIQFNMWKYFLNVHVHSIAISLLATVFPYVIIKNMEEGWLRLCFTTIFSVFSTGLCVYYLGLSKNARIMMKEKLVERLWKRNA